MNMKNKNHENRNDCAREHEFALIVSRQVAPNELTEEVEAALFEAGCDDATLSIQRGLFYLEFSRQAPSLQAAILSAIAAVRKAGLGLMVWRVDECDLVTPSEIARRIDRSRQLIHQYMTGQRGPGKFPPPVCHLTEGSPLWAWCAVSHWLVTNDLLRPEEGWNAQVVAAINNWLESAIQKAQNPKLVKEIAGSLR